MTTATAPAPAPTHAGAPQRSLVGRIDLGALDRPAIRAEGPALQHTGLDLQAALALCHTVLRHAVPLRTLLCADRGRSAWCDHATAQDHCQYTDR